MSSMSEGANPYLTYLVIQATFDIREEWKREDAEETNKRLDEWIEKWIKNPSWWRRLFRTPLTNTEIIDHYSGWYEGHLYDYTAVEVAKINVAAQVSEGDLFWLTPSQFRLIWKHYDRLKEAMGNLSPDSA
jgi:hypothetical protein